MINLSKYDFPQETPSHPFKTIKLSGLSHALFFHRLNGSIPKIPERRRLRDPLSGRFAWARRAQHPTIRRAKQWSEAQILSDLRDDTITAYLPADVGGIFYRIESEFWHDKMAGLSVGGKLLYFEDSNAVPYELLGRTIYVFAQCAFACLAKHEIGSRHPAYPASLHGIKPPTEHRKQPQWRPSRIGKWCVETGVQILVERRGLSPKFKQAHLIQEIYRRRPNHWGDEEPSDASMKRYAARAITQFEERRA